MTFTLISQLVLTLLFSFAMSRFGLALAGSREVPINIVAAIIAKVVHRHWSKVRPHFDRAATIPEGLRFLQLAQEYLSCRAAGIYRLETERSRSRATYMTRPHDIEESKPLSATTTAFIILVLSVAAALLLYGLLVYLQEKPAFVFGLAVLITLFLWLENRPSKPEPDFVPVIGPADSWEKWQLRTSKECLAERSEIFMAITGAGGHIESNLNDQAPELPAAEGTALPAPPGLTELVLVNFPEALKEISNEIVTLRRFHLRVFVSILVLWFLIILGGFGLQTFWLKQSWNSSLGTLGFALIIGGILWGFLPAVRTSHIALALYRSYQLELIQNLKAAEDTSEMKKRSALRAQAWERFRAGLNKLWLQENRASAFTANLFRQNSQKGDQPGEEIRDA